MKTEQQELQLKRLDDCWAGYFRAMASPCEVLMDVDDEQLAGDILQAVSTEALRIEHKFSRYRDDNIVYQINHANGAAVSVDDETTRLLDFANQLFDLSEGLFDVTSGVLRKVWQFDGGDQVPTQDMIDSVMPLIGWQKVSSQPGEICLQPGMQIDLGGIGKEYAVDSSAAIARKLTAKSVLVNFGGDLMTTAPRDNNRFWSIGRLITGRTEAVSLFELRRGAIATSGDAHRYLLKDGIRYSHVLNPLTGMSVLDAPHTVSVAAPTCIEAGMYATLAMLQGGEAAAFLEAQGLDYWID